MSNDSISKIPSTSVQRYIDIEELLLKIYAKEMSVQNGRKWAAIDLRHLCQIAQQKANEKKADSLRQSFGTVLQGTAGLAGVASDAIIKTSPLSGIVFKASSKLLDTSHSQYKGTKNSEGTHYDHRYQVLSNMNNETTEQKREADKSIEAMIELFAKFLRRDEQFTQSFTSSAA